MAKEERKFSETEFAQAMLDGVSPKQAALDALDIAYEAGVQSVNNKQECEHCNNITFMNYQNAGDYPESAESGIYKNEDGYYWFNKCEDSWYSGFVHKVEYCPFCGSKVK